MVFGSGVLKSRSIFFEIILDYFSRAWHFFDCGNIFDISEAFFSTKIKIFEFAFTSTQKKVQNQNQPQPPQKTKITTTLHSLKYSITPYNNDIYILKNVTELGVFVFIYTRNG